MARGNRSPPRPTPQLLTRELLANYFHESLDTVAEKMMVSKTTIKAACRRLGLVPTRDPILATLEATQGQISGFFSELPIEFYLLEVVSVGD